VPLSCSLGFHSWDGCKCSKCGESRDKGHDWSKSCEYCPRCSKKRTGIHRWKDCKCLKCPIIRHEPTTCNCRKVSFDRNGMEFTIPADSLLHLRKGGDETIVKWCKKLERHLNVKRNESLVELPQDWKFEWLVPHLVKHPLNQFAVVCIRCNKKYEWTEHRSHFELGEHGGSLNVISCPKGHGLLYHDGRLAGWGPPSPTAYLPPPYGSR